MGRVAGALRGLPANGALVDFSYWDKVDALSFLADDWENRSREWAGKTVASLVERGAKTMVEVGPGAGVDYARHFYPLVQAGRLYYTGFEGSAGLCRALQQKYPAAMWQNVPIESLPERAFDVAYARHVLEHQPTLEPALSKLLGAAVSHAIIVWYRPPAAAAFAEYDAANNVYYQTFERAAVLKSVEAAGFELAEERSVEPPHSGWVPNLCWLLRRVRSEPDKVVCPTCGKIK